MRIPYLGLIVILILNLGVDWYIFRFLHSEFRRRIWSKIQLWSALILAAGILALFFFPVRSTSDTAMQTLMWCIFAYISVYLPKYIFVIFDCMARLPMLWHRRRLKWLTRFGTLIGAIIFIALWWGALINRYNINERDINIDVEGLPSAFNGFRIVQISDLHVGSYGQNDRFLRKLVEKIDELQPDIIFFTGDIVNRHTDELEPFTRVLSGLKARYGVYSVLGNHDYGDYYEWPDTAMRTANNNRLAELQKEMGWQLLLNSHDIIRIGSDSIAVVGVENIGDPPFHVYGNLESAYPNLSDSVTKILLSHNPAHWVADIADSDKNIALTLSGHTHAMQITVFGWSPSSLRYRTWGGLYTDKTGRHSLYVNIGTGTVGFPARIGATPEVTLITLHSTKDHE